MFHGPYPYGPLGFSFIYFCNFLGFLTRFRDPSIACIVCIKELKDIDPEKVVKKREGNFYDRKSKTIYMRNLKATDLKNNIRVILPDLEDDESEIRRNHVKN